MAPPKLSQVEKQDILQLYSEMSNAELAQRFGVSISTIARVIKEGKDQALIQPKKTPKQAQQLDLIAPMAIAELQEETPSMAPIDRDINIDQEISLVDPIDRDINEDDTDVPGEEPEEMEPIDRDINIDQDIPLDPIDRNINEDTDVPGEEPEEMEPIEAIRALQAVVGDDFEDDSDLGEEEEEPEEEEPIEEVTTPSVLTILPFYELWLPEQCYLVVDKALEVVTRPLKDFRELGILPPDKEHCRTLPVFLNQRLARRFSNPHQRIIKMPGYLLNSTHEKLRQKGITYILCNHMVYSL